MKYFTAHIAFIVFILGIHNLYSQEKNSFDDGKFVVKGSVIESDSRDPIQNVNVEIVGGSYTTTDFSGKFEIEARVGDQLIITYKDFETVYYNIKSDERIIVEVEPQEENESYSKSKKKSRYGTSTNLFKPLIDSSKNYLRTDAQKSIQFVADALRESNSIRDNALAYETLGDIYMFWKQYDLAVTNYRISLQSVKKEAVNLKLAHAYKWNKNYQESISLYNSINKRELSNYELVTLYESLGDVYVLIKDFESAEKAYNKGLVIAQKHLISPKVTDLNSKLGDVFDVAGNKQEAQLQFSKSLDLANKENKKRAVEEKIKVADFQNKQNNYEDEIQLRKEALSDLDEIAKDSVLDITSSLTTQKQNYKIGNAYALQQDFESAIPYLEKSIAEADLEEDLIVKKDATRKLSEVYRDAGQFDKALLAYQDYVDVVDKLYSKKEQEISQAARFSKDIISKQNRILSLESDRELSESKYQLSVEQAKRQKLIIYSLTGGLLLLIIVAFLMYKYIKQQRLANNLLALKSLRSQMNPHFIFNALNSVNSFIASSDERTANKYLTDFSLLMRAVLENSEEDFIPLEKEIELLELYTQLEHFRFQDKFDYSITVDDKIEVTDFVIPPMLLQPYIENAVWHGLRYKMSKGFLDISIFQRSSNEINIVIADNGIGREKSKALKTKNQQKQNSKGMGNIKKRVSILNSMYKDKVSVQVDDYQNEEDKGTKVVVTLKKD